MHCGCTIGTLVHNVCMPCEIWWTCTVVLKPPIFTLWHRLYTMSTLWHWPSSTDIWAWPAFKLYHEYIMTLTFTRVHYDTDLPLLISWKLTVLKLYHEYTMTLTLPWVHYGTDLPPLISEPGQLGGNRAVQQQLCSSFYHHQGRWLFQEFDALPQHICFICKYKWIVVRWRH